MEFVKFKEVLHPDEQARLLEVAKADQEAKALLVEHNSRLVMWVAKQYYYENKTELEDLFQCGIIGLMEAIDRYDPNRGAAFSTVAVWCIRKEIKRNILEIHDLSLDEHVADNLTLGEVIPDDNDGVETATARLFIQEFKEYFKGKLDPLQYETIVLSCGLSDRVYTLDEMSEMLNVSISQIRYAKAAGLNEVRRSVFIKNLMPVLDDNTSFYRTTDYSSPKTKGSSWASPVESIVIERENWIEKMVNKYLSDKG